MWKVTHSKKKPFVMAVQKLCVFCKAADIYIKYTPTNTSTHAHTDTDAIMHERVLTYRHTDTDTPGAYT